jgi:hypothetical protein
MAHEHDVCMEITGTKGKVMVNLVLRRDNVMVVGEGGIRHEVQPGTGSGSRMRSSQSRMSLLRLS